MSEMRRRVRRSICAALVVALAAPLVSALPVSVFAGPAPRPTAIVPPGAATYVAVTPARLADTRGIGYGFTRLSSSTIRVQVAGRFGVPTNATAAVLNITAADTRAAGYVTVYPSQVVPRPEVSNLNVDTPGRVVANMATVRLGVDGAVEIYASGAMGIIVDVSGAYVPVTDPSAEGRFIARTDGAKRVLDTRQQGQLPLARGDTRSVDLTPSEIPSHASAVVVNVTAVTAASGYWTVFPAGTSIPDTSTLNLDQTGQTRPAQAIVRIIDGQLAINVYTPSGGHLIVDVAGWFTGADTPDVSIDGLFIPTTPMRLLDSRSKSILAPWGGSTLEFGVNGPMSNISAVALNLTGVQPWTTGFVTAYPAGLELPLASNLNVAGYGQVIANHAIVRVSERGVALYTSGGVHLIADLAGWYLGTPAGATNAKPTNPIYKPNQAVGLSGLKTWNPYKILEVRTGSDLDYLADQGYAVGFINGANVAQLGNVMLFGHRTKLSANRPFYYLDQMVPGTTFTLHGTDGHKYLYEVVRLDITRPDFIAITNLAKPYGPVTAQLVACHPLHSITRRIVATARLIGVT